MNEEYGLALCRFRGGISQPGEIKDGICYVATPLDFNIYKVSKDTALKIYQIIFPADRVLAHSIIQSKNINFLDSVQNSFKYNQTLILNIESIFWVKSKLFFRIRTPAYIPSIHNGYQYNFAYDTISKKLIGIDRINPDKVSYFLPLLGEESKNKGFIGYKQYLYGYISSLSLFTTAKKNKLSDYPPKLQKYFATQNRKSNPVIVKLKLKDSN